MKISLHSLFGRLAVGLVLTALAAVLVATAFLYLRFHQTDTRFREGTLRSFAVGIAADIAANHGRSYAANLRTERQLARAGGTYAVVDGDERWLGGTAPDHQAFVPTDGKTPFFFELPGATPGTTRYGLVLRINGIDPPTYVEVVCPLGEIVFDSVLEEFIKDIAWLWLPFLALILITNLAVAHIALAPVRLAVAQAQAITTQAVAAPIDETNLPADVQALVRAVNLAFARLQASYRTLEEFVADIAHDLRTPITIMKLQFARAKSQDAEAITPEIERIERLVEQLLDRARIGRLSVTPEDQVDLAELCRRVAEFLAPLVIARGRSIELVGADRPLLVAGIFDDLFRALRNLLENGLSHAPVGSTLTVMVDADTTSVSVIDDGPGFVDDILALDVNERTAIRSDRFEGAGLGLSIAARTLQAFGGRLQLANVPSRGASARMILKPWRAPERPS